jgi:protein-L-isoaspartate O-methyltransferase
MVSNAELIEEVKKKIAHVIKENNLNNPQEEHEYIKDYAPILQAMEEINRNDFIPGMYKIASYDDKAIPIGEFQKSEVPSELAKIAYLLELKNGDVLLEVGMGSGYSTALFYKLISPEGKIVTYDRNKKLCGMGQNNLSKIFGEAVITRKISIHYDNAYNLPKKLITESFTKIYISAGIDVNKFPLDDFILLLKPNGLLVFPDTKGNLYVYTRSQRNKPFLMEECKGFTFDELKHGTE